jgi:hypothetical protein
LPFGESPQALNTNVTPTNTNLRAGDTPNLTPIDSIISSYLDHSNSPRTPRDLNPESFALKSVGRFVGDSVNKSGKYHYYDIQNLILPTENFNQIYKESKTLLEEVKSKHRELELVQLEVNFLKCKFES